jgi:hypothetical protein
VLVLVVDVVVALVVTGHASHNDGHFAWKESAKIPFSQRSAGMPKHIRLSATPLLQDPSVGVVVDVLVDVKRQPHLHVGGNVSYETTVVGLPCRHSTLHSPS